MTTKEAIQAMLDGKKVRRHCWVEGDYFMFDGECFIAGDATVVMADFNGNDWEIYEEPKPKQTVTVEKWLCASGFNMAYYTVEATKEYFDRYTKDRVKLLDTYEVTL